MRIGFAGLAVLVLGGCATSTTPLMTSAPSVAAVVEPGQVQRVAERPSTATPGIVRDPPPVVPGRSPPPPRIPDKAKEQKAAQPATLAIVVIDGDTVDINGARWRLTGYDAPEITDRAKCQREKDLGEKAKRRLQQILGSGHVETDTKGVRDDKGRLLGTIRVNGRNVGDMLKAESLARPMGSRTVDWCAGQPKPVKTAPPGGACKGLAEGACRAASGCRWVVHATPTDKTGRPVTDYCRKGRG